jgi:hypothetical protein
LSLASLSSLESISSTFFLAWLFQSFFCAQLIATCEWQPVQLSVTCEWHNQHNFLMKKHGEIRFQKKQLFCLSRKKAMRKHGDKIYA